MVLYTWTGQLECSDVLLGERQLLFLSLVWYPQSSTMDIVDVFFSPYFLFSCVTSKLISLTRRSEGAKELLKSGAKQFNIAIDLYSSLCDTRHTWVELSKRQ